MLYLLIFIYVRASLLKQHRLERHKKAIERRHRLEDERKGRWKKSGHFICHKGKV